MLLREAEELLQILYQCGCLIAYTSTPLELDVG